MRAIKNFYIIISLIALMIVRLFAPGEWFGSIVLAGLFVTLLDTIRKIQINNAHITDESSKKRYAIVHIVLIIIGAVLLILAIINLVHNITWLNKPIVLDEFTLFTLLVCLAQNTVVDIANSIIKNGHEVGNNG